MTDRRTDRHELEVLTIALGVGSQVMCATLCFACKFIINLPSLCRRYTRTPDYEYHSFLPNLIQSCDLDLGS